MNKLLYNILIIILLLQQIADGILTYIGVISFGTVNVEGNYMLRYLMSSIGVIPALVSAKLIACIIIIIVYNMIRAHQVNKKMLALIVSILLLYSAAIIAWCYILFLR